MERRGEERRTLEKDLRPRFRAAEIGPRVLARFSELRKQYFHGTSEERANPPAISQEVADKPPPRLSTSFPRIDRAFRARFDIAARMPPGIKDPPFLLN